MVAAISSFHDTKIVFAAFGITLVSTHNNSFNNFDSLKCVDIT